MKSRMICFLLLIIFLCVTERVVGNENSGTFSVKVVYNEEGGLLKINDTYLKSGESISVESLSNVAIFVTPKEGYCGSFSDSSVQPNIPVSEFGADNFNPYNTGPMVFLFKKLSTNIIFYYKFCKLHEIIVEVLDESGMNKVNSIDLDGWKKLYAIDEYKCMVREDLKYLKFNVKNNGSCLKQVLFDNIDLTSQIDGDKLEPKKAPKDRIKVVFGKKDGFYYVKDGNTSDQPGHVTVNGEYLPLLVSSSDQLNINFFPKNGYMLKSCSVNDIDVTDKVVENKLNIPNVSEDILLKYSFDKPISFRVEFDEGGEVWVNNKKVTDSRYNISVATGTDIKVKIIPDFGYCLKSIEVNGIDKTSFVQDKELTIHSEDYNWWSGKIYVSFEKEMYSVQVDYNDGGWIRMNNKTINSGFTTNIDAFTYILLDIYPNQGYHLKNVTVGGVDKTNEVSDNQLDISSISKDQKISIVFEKDVPVNYTVRVSYNNGGTIKINDKLVSDGTSTTVAASTNVQLSIVPNSGYHLKSVTVGGVDKTSEVRNNQLTITSISKNQEISILFEKDASINYTVKVSYYEGGKIKVNNNFVDNGTITTVTVPADVQLSVVPDKGYHLKQIVVGGVDKTNEVKENQLFFYSISENLEVSVAFEKDVPTSYTLSINRSGSGGYVKVNGQNVGDETISIPASGVILIFVLDETHPEYKYRVHRVTLNGKDITDQIKDNSYTILSPSENLSLYVDFKEIPIYRFTIEQKNGEGGLVKIGDEVLNSFSYSSYIYEGEFLIIQFLENKYFELDKVFLEDDDISDQVENGFLKMKLTSYYNSHITINYKPKKYTLSLTDIQHIEQISKGWESLPLQKNIQIDAGSGLPLWIRANEFYAIVKVLLDGEIVYQVADLKLADNYAQIEHIDMNKDKELTIILKLKEVRALEVDVKEPGTLSSYLSEENIKLATDLYVQGNIDQRDFVIMNQMESLSDLKIRADINKYMDYPANEIPKKAFYNNKTIHSITIPASLESIGTQAFYGSVLNKFTSFDTYMRLKSIGEEAFKDCKYLTDMYYCADIKVIEKGTFENCLNLKQMSSQNVIEIKESAFRNCKNLTFYLDGSLEKIGDYAFENVHEVKDNGYYFENPQLSYIGKNALKGCQNESFNFKTYMNLNELPSFEGCSKLTSITLPKNVKQIPVGIFTGCTSLAYVYMSENIEYIAENAFSDCNSLYYLYIPVSKTPEVFNNSFSDLNYQLTKLAVPADYLPFYKNHPVWGKFSVIEPIGQASTYPVEIILSEGGSLKFRINKDDYWQDVNSSYLWDI